MAQPGAGLSMTGGTAHSAPELSAQFAAAFDRARQTSESHDVSRTIADHTVRFSFAGNGLGESMLQALTGAPGSTDPSPALTVKAWDRKSAGVGLQLPASLVSSAGRLGLIESLCDERFRILLGAAVGLIDLEAREAYYYVDDPRRLPYWELAHPARVLLSTWASEMNLRMCHGAAVGEGDEGSLVVGSGGSGKSTVALACLGDGMLCAGDDYVLLEDGSSPVVHSVYTSTLLHLDHRQRWPALMPRIDNERGVQTGEKAVMFTRPGLITGGFRIRSVVVPRVGGSGVRAIGAGRALRALAPSSIIQLGSFDENALSELSALCRSLPCLELGISGEVGEIPTMMREAFEMARAMAPTS